MQANEQSKELAPHYKKQEKDGKQHWDQMWEKYREAWFVGNITKYIGRYRDKNGLADLKKCLHYLTKLIELETAELEAEELEERDIKKAKNAEAETIAERESKDFKEYE